MTYEIRNNLIQKHCNLPLWPIRNMIFLGSKYALICWNWKSRSGAWITCHLLYDFRNKNTCKCCIRPKNTCTEVSSPQDYTSHCDCIFIITHIMSYWRNDDTKYIMLWNDYKNTSIVLVVPPKRVEVYCHNEDISQKTQNNDLSHGWHDI